MSMLLAWEAAVCEWSGRIYVAAISNLVGFEIFYSTERLE